MGSTIQRDPIGGLIGGDAIYITPNEYAQILVGAGVELTESQKRDGVPWTGLRLPPNPSVAPYRHMQDRLSAEDRDSVERLVFEKVIRDHFSEAARESARYGIDPEWLRGTDNPVTVNGETFSSGYGAALSRMRTLAQKNNTAQALTEAIQSGTLPREVSGETEWTAQAAARVLMDSARMYSDLGDDQAAMGAARLAAVLKSPESWGNLKDTAARSYWLTRLGTRLGDGAYELSQYLGHVTGEVASARSAPMGDRALIEFYRTQDHPGSFARLVRPDVLMSVSHDLSGVREELSSDIYDIAEILADARTGDLKAIRRWDDWDRWRTNLSNQYEQLERRAAEEELGEGWMNWMRSFVPGLKDKSGQTQYGGQMLHPLQGMPAGHLRREAGSPTVAESVRSVRTVLNPLVTAGLGTRHSVAGGVAKSLMSQPGFISSLTNMSVGGGFRPLDEETSNQLAGESVKELTYPFRATATGDAPEYMPGEVYTRDIKELGEWLQGAKNMAPEDAERTGQEMLGRWISKHAEEIGGTAEVGTLIGAGSMLGSAGRATMAPRVLGTRVFEPGAFSKAVGSAVKAEHYMSTGALQYHPDMIGFNLLGGIGRGPISSKVGGYGPITGAEVHRFRAREEYEKRKQQLVEDMQKRQADAERGITPPY